MDESGIVSNISQTKKESTFLVKYQSDIFNCQVVRGEHHRDTLPPPAGAEYKRVFSGENRPSLFEIAGVPPVAAAAAAAGPGGGGGGGRYPLSDYRPQIPDGGGGRMLHSVGHPGRLEVTIMDGE